MGDNTCNCNYEADITNIRPTRQDKITIGPRLHIKDYIVYSLFHLLQFITLFFMTVPQPQVKYIAMFHACQMQKKSVSNHHRRLSVFDETKRNDTDKTGFL